MRGMFIGLMVMGAVWTGGLAWSIFGGMVLVPGSTLSIGAPRAAVAPAPAPASQARPAAPAAQQNVPAIKAPAPGQDPHAASGHAVSHAAAVPTSTRGNQVLEPKLVDGV